jgi:prepilin-type N-terminal cleavage/methylation domain-containing protein
MSKARRYGKTATSGFTLIELMIVVAIIGILAAIAIPKFASLIRQSGEGASKGNLGALRSALNIYYGNLNGLYPQTLATLTTNGAFMGAIPVAKAPNYHTDSSGETDDQTFTSNDFGGWEYDNNNGDANYGNVWVSCTHTDTKGNVWDTY